MYSYFHNCFANIREPTLLFERGRVRSNSKFIYDCAKGIFCKVLPFFAVKVAPIEEVVSVVCEDKSWGCEVYNDNDLELAVKGGCNNIIVDGYFKPHDFLERCINNRVFAINIESVNEAIAINTICRDIGVRCRVGLRCKTSDASKMGFSIHEILEAITILKAMKNIDICGVHTHPGSNSQGTQDAYDAYRYLSNAARVLRDAGFHLEYIDIGGGIGEIALLGGRLRDCFAEVGNIFSDFKDCVYCIESGRGVVGDAGALVCQVVSIDRLDRLVNVNIAVSPYFATTGATFRYAFPGHGNGSTLSELLDYSIGGIWPTSRDVISCDALYNKIPADVEVGDNFVLFNAGAYTADRLQEYSFSRIPIMMI